MLIITPGEMESGIDDLALTIWHKMLKIGGASGAAWKLRIGDNPPEWPAQHDYPQSKEGIAERSE